MSPEEREAGLTALALVRTALEKSDDPEAAVLDSAALLDGKDVQELGEVLASMTGMTVSILTGLEEQEREDLMTGALDYYLEGDGG